MTRMEATRQQRWWQGGQQGPGWGKRGINNSGKSKGNAATTAVRMIARETQQDEGGTATTIGYHSNGGGEVESDGGGESKGSTATTMGYLGNGSDGDEDNSKGNSGKNRERGGNNSSSDSLLSLFFVFLVALTRWSHGCFVCLINICHVIDTYHGTPVHVNWHTLSDSSKGFV